MGLVFLLLSAACAQVPPGAVQFGLLGDTPYSDDEVRRLERVIDDMNAAQLGFVVHLGDIGSARLGCTDAWIEARKRQFARIAAPFILLPGDNEWSDCREPLARLKRWRALFCFQERIPLERQAGEFCEHIRWRAGGWIFIALNVQGSNNNVLHPEHGPRMAAVYAWLEESAKLAESAEGLAVLMQANPFVVVPRDGFAGLRERLAELGRRRPGRVALIHGDTHVYHDDEPIVGVRRLETWGAPITGWVPAAVAGRELVFRTPRIP